MTVWKKTTQGLTRHENALYSRVGAPPSKPSASVRSMFVSGLMPRSRRVKASHNWENKGGKIFCWYLYERQSLNSRSLAWIINRCFQYGVSSLLYIFAKQIIVFLTLFQDKVGAVVLTVQYLFSYLVTFVKITLGPILSLPRSEIKQTTLIYLEKFKKTKVNGS